MDESQQSGTGFPPHVQEQLREAARTVSTPPSRGRGQNWRGRGRPHSGNQPHYQGPQRQYVSEPQHAQPSNSQSWGNQTMTNPTDLNSFPPLGTAPSRSPATAQQTVASNAQQLPPQVRHRNPRPPTMSVPYNGPYPPPQASRQDFSVRARGGQYRGRGHTQASSDQRQYAQGQGRAHNANDFSRPPPPVQRRLFTGTNPQFNSVEEQRIFQRRIMDQSDFLNHLANQSLKSQLTTEEQQEKECFRKELETIAQKAIADARTESMTIDPSRVQLKLYGSLGSGFGVAGSDMDLLLAFPQNEGPLGNIEIESRRLLEKALLDVGIGARLLTNTRVPILRVCQKPNPELLKNLRECRSRWEQGLDIHDPLPAVDEGFGSLPTLTDLQVDAAAEALTGLDLSACEVPLPDSPPPDHAKLEYVGDCGIQCDINFSNYVALHNTRLLRTYALCDSRVRQVGVFVKSWAKARDINTPYRGTLSSYGYILMVLHYLMHVVNPPLIPNLQELAKQKDSWEGKTDVELVEGFDVRFMRDMNEIQTVLQDMPRNHESVGSLLRGFFWYYGDGRGFHWTQDVISFRSRSGRLTKKAKGWTGAKWSETNSNVRLRYLLAIEDPFELDHNVARTVGHSGVVAIRDEFRRAWSAIDNIKFDQETRIWYWTNPTGQNIQGDELMSVIENRGDLLRLDKDHHRQRARQMRQDLEAEEKASQEAAAQEAEDVEGKEINGTSEKSQSVAQDVNSLLDPSSSTLINNDNFQMKKIQQPPNRRVLREDDDEEETWMTQEIKPSNIDWDKPFSGAEISINAEWVDDGRWTGDVVNESKQEQNVVNWQAPISQQWEDVVDTNEPVVYDHEDLKDQESVQNESKESHHDETLEVRIQWDMRTSGGRWLQWRDRRIRQGTWTGASGVFRLLDEEFPYDPNMTMVDLAIKNKRLSSLYSNSHMPRRQTERNQNDQPMTAISKPHSEWSVSANSLRTAQMTTNSKDSMSLVDLKSGTSTRSPNSNASEPKKSSNLRRRQQKKPAKMKNTSTPTRLSDQITTTQSIQDHTPPPPNVATEPSNPAAKELLKLFKTSPPHHHTTNPQPPNSTSLTSDSNVSKSLTTTTLPQPKPQISQSQSLVPLTLYPDHQSSTRPRDEDPNIMPIPRSLGFRFDPRQLADLEVIRRGGNGCARFGEEFEVEVDYEFGGAGDIVPVGGESAMANLGIDMDMDTEEEGKERKTNRWSAKGDVEGFLGELPGLIDID